MRHTAPPLLVAADPLARMFCPVLDQIGAMAPSADLPATPGDATVLLTISTADSATAEEYGAFSRTHGLHWLPVVYDLGIIIIGPILPYGGSGCLICAERRRRAVYEHSAAERALHSRVDLLAHLPRLPAHATTLVEQVLTESLAALQTGAQTAHTVRAQVRLPLDTLMLQRHRLLPDALCPVCGVLPLDSSMAGVIEPISQPKPRPSQFRLRALRDERTLLIDQYVDAELGMVRALYKDESNFFANVSAPMRLPDVLVDEVGFGRTLDYSLSQAAAIAEAIERYGGVRPGGKRTAVHASFRELGASALDPQTLGLHSAEQHARADFPFPPYDPDATYPWVWGYSLTDRRPILVPERYAYYGPARQQKFVYEISNGCALGSSLTEAICYGILEVAERDAFLMTWYAQMPVPRIDGATLPLTAQLMIERIEAVTGYCVHVFDITLEQGIPAIWVLAVDENERADHPRMLCAAGAHFIPEQALTSALHELAPMLSRLPERYQSNRDAAHRLAEDSDNVRWMEDHTLAYCAPSAFSRLAFLYTTPHTSTWRAAQQRWHWPQHDDLTDDLAELVARYQKSELPIIVVDQTTSEHREGGFACVKVIIPGTLPMTFGQAMRRVNGLPRLRTVPASLGYTPPAQPNPYPHPFP